jgi:hypothetical protein
MEILLLIFVVLLSGAICALASLWLFRDDQARRPEVRALKIARRPEVRALKIARRDDTHHDWAGTVRVYHDKT